MPELLAAWELRPVRAEPLLELARGYRSRGAPHLARTFARMGLDLPYPGDDLLFVHPEAYEWALRFEHAIAAYHCGDAEQALADNDRLLADGVPTWVEPWVHHNRAWCLHALGRGELPTRALLPAVTGEPGPTLAELAPSTSLTLLDVPDPGGWSSFNPSVANDALGGLHVIVRSSNYQLGPGGTYDFLTDDDAAAAVVRTRNRLVALDDRLRPISTVALPAVPPGAEVFPSQVVGCEDLRLVHLDGRWRATATVRDRNPDWRCEIALLDLGPPTTRGHRPPRRCGSCRGPTRIATRRTGCRSSTTAPSTSSTSAPRRRCCGSATRAEIELVSQTPGPPALTAAEAAPRACRSTAGTCSSCTRPPPAGPWGGSTPTASCCWPNGRAGGSITATSPPFQLLEPVIEFCAGLARHPADPDRVVLSFGHTDSTAWLADVLLSELLDLLEPTGV